MGESLVIRAGAGAASTYELQSCIEALLAEATSRPEVSREATRAAQVASVTVVQDSSGLDPLTTTILITIAANLTTESIKGLWQSYLFPGIRRKLGSDAVDEDRLSIENPASTDHPDSDGDPSDGTV